MFLVLQSRSAASRRKGGTPGGAPLAERMASTVGSFRTPSGCDRPRGGISTTRPRGSFLRSSLNLRFVPSLTPPLLSPPHSQPALIRLTMSLRSPSSLSSKPSSPEKCPGAPDLRTLACPVFPPFELYADDSLDIPSMSEGTSAETSLILPSPAPQSTSRIFQVLTTSLKRPGPLRGRPTSKPTKGFGWIDLVKQGGATPESLSHPHFPSDNELRLFFHDLDPESSPSLVSHDSAAFEDTADDLPPPCLLNTFSSLSKRTHQPSHSHSRSHSGNPTTRDRRPPTEPEIPQDDDVFFHRDLQRSSRTRPSGRMVGSIILTTVPYSDYGFLQGMKETNDQED